MYRFIGVLAISAVATLASCSSDSATAPASTVSLAGSYTLRTVNGAVLPYIIVQVGADKIELLNETIVVAEGATFTRQGSVRITERGIVSTEGFAEAGTYVRFGNTVTFLFNRGWFNWDGSEGSATFNGATLTVGIEGGSLVYRK